MLKQMRKHAKYFYFLFAIVIVAFIFWIPGMGTNSSTQTQVLAEIGDQTITEREYWQEHKRMSDLYREVYREDFDAEAMNLKGIVLDRLVEEKLLFIAAREAGITVTDRELQEAIVNNSTFQGDRGFDRQVYENRLRLNSLSTAAYEASLRKQLLLDKMRRMVEETVELSPKEIQTLSQGEEDLSSLRQTLLDAKRTQALRAFLNGVKRRVPVTINRQLINL